MLGFKKKQKAPLSVEKLDRVIEILETVGFTDKWGFRDHVVDRSRYFGGSFEWTDRGVGMRYLFYINFNTGKVYEVKAVLHGANFFTQEQVNTANEALAKLF